MRDLLHGVLITGFAVAALRFLSFWRVSRDRLFALFAGAFALMAANVALIAATDDAQESQVLVYLVRLLAFLLILVAIIDKNRGQGTS